MSIRRFGLLAAIVTGFLLVAPVAANAQTTTPTPVTATSFNSIPVTGTANGKTLRNGHFSVQQFVTRGGKSYALGTLTGRAGHRSVDRSNVAIPISDPQPNGKAHDAATCQILNLVLGPLHLNLLGLHIDLNQVILNITGVTGSGQLLGNLLCGIANLLNGTPVTPAQLAGVLNIVNQLTGIASLAGL